MHSAARALRPLQRIKSRILFVIEQISLDQLAHPDLVMAEPNDLYSRSPTFHDTDAGYILPNEYVPFAISVPCSFFYTAQQSMTASSINTTP